ncbi:MAG TPA: hypothetical protein VHO28_10685 [Ignavibacteriales bacterium]|nr:hypothetical protein [Ignavibacteriales bacterium]
MKFRYILLIFAAFALNTVTAQSDYQLTQDFKKQYKALEDRVDKAQTTDELKQIEGSVAELHTKFQPNKTLLDKALYPETFESSFQNLERKLQAVTISTTQITELKTEVGKLTDIVTKLSQENNTLYDQIKQLQGQRAKDVKSLDSLNRLVERLRANIRRRDELILNVVDSLFLQFGHKTGNLTEMEQGQIAQKLETTNLFDNLKRMINDNMRFLDATELAPGELSQMKKEQNTLESRWKKMGPQLADIYIAGKQNRENAKSDVDNLLRSWEREIDGEIWSSIDDAFKQRNIFLNPYNNGDEFANSISAYVENQIQNPEGLPADQRFANRNLFIDSVWNKDLNETWMPVLLENNLLTEAQKDSIQAKIDEWGENVKEPVNIWVYVAAGVILLLLIVLIVRAFRSGKKAAPAADTKPEEPKQNA